MTSSEKLRSALHHLLKLDYGVGGRISDETPMRFRVSLYHLSDPQNMLSTTTTNGVELSFSGVNAQDYNVSCSMRSLGYAMHDLYQKEFLGVISRELDYYSGLAARLYDAKYSEDIERHTRQGA